MTVLFVEYPKCSTCKKAKAWLDEHGVEYIDRDIVLDNPTADELATWIARSGLPVRRCQNPAYLCRPCSLLLQISLRSAVEWEKSCM